jgi:hypothetical protein
MLHLIGKNVATQGWIPCSNNSNNYLQKYWEFLNTYEVTDISDVTT